MRKQEMQYKLNALEEQLDEMCGEVRGIREALQELEIDGPNLRDRVLALYEYLGLEIEPTPLPEKDYIVCKKVKEKG